MAMNLSKNKICSGKILSVLFRRYSIRFPVFSLTSLQSEIYRMRHPGGLLLPLVSYRTFNMQRIYPRVLCSLRSGKFTQFHQVKILRYSQPQPQQNIPLTLTSEDVKDSKTIKEKEEKPNQDRLQVVHDVLTDSLSKLFLQPMNYSVYNHQVVFIDNIRNKTVQGIFNYVQQVAYLRMVGHFKFAFVRFEVLNSHISVEESRITIRWRICGISGLRVMLKFWKFRLWNWKEIMDQKELWYDGISYFDVGTDGLVYRHIADKMMEDKSRQAEKIQQPAKVALAAKLGLLTSLFPQPTSLSNVLMLQSCTLQNQRQLYQCNGRR